MGPSLSTRRSFQRYAIVLVQIAPAFGPRLVPIKVTPVSSNWSPSAKFDFPEPGGISLTRRGVITSDERAIVVDSERCRPTARRSPRRAAACRTPIRFAWTGRPVCARCCRGADRQRGCATCRPRCRSSAEPNACESMFPSNQHHRVTAEILDRGGKPVNVPVDAFTRVEGSLTWATAELSLAPLAAGDYVVRLTAGSQSVMAFRLTP